MAMPPQGQPPQQQSSGGGLAEVVARVQSDLSKLAQAVPELEAVLDAYEATIQQVQSGGQKQQAPAPQAPQGPVSAQGGPKGVPV